MAGAAVECHRGQWPAGGPELDVPDGRDEGARAAAVRDVLCRELDLQLQQVLRRLPAVVTADSGIAPDPPAPLGARVRAPVGWRISDAPGVPPSPRERGEG